MRTQRLKQQDWSKSFKIVYSKSQFESLQTSDQTIINITTKQPTAHKKQQIITPHYQTIKRVTEIKPFAKLNPNYVRLQSHLNLPKLNDYELTQLDHIFIQTHKDKYKLNGKMILNQQFLKSIIIALQKKQGKDMVIPRSKGYLIAFLDKEYKQLSKMSNFETFTDLIYNYWRNRREEVKFPLFRPLWRPNQDQYNHLLAFKFRQKQKRSLRRSSRTSEEDILQELANELAIALKVSERVQMRQKLKQKQVEVQFNLFHNELKSIFPAPDFLSEVSVQNRNKDREKIKRTNLELEKIRKQRQVKNEEYKQPQPSIFDQKQSVVNFLATVVAEAELYGLSYDKIFHYKSEVVPAPIFTIVKQSTIVQIPSIQQEQECLSLSLRRAGDYVLRHFEMDSESQQSEQKQSQITSLLKRDVNKVTAGEDVFDFKKKKVCLYYFGDDDEGDYQNLRKNISMSFKKFQMSKEMK